MHIPSCFLGVLDHSCDSTLCTTTTQKIFLYYPMERNTGREIPKSSRFKFLEKFLANDLALSDA